LRTFTELLAFGNSYRGNLADGTNNEKKQGEGRRLFKERGNNLSGWKMMPKGWKRGTDRIVIGGEICSGIERKSDGTGCIRSKNDSEVYYNC